MGSAFECATFVGQDTGAGGLEKAGRAEAVKAVLDELLVLEDPGLADFPPVAARHAAALHSSIERKGILEPLICTPTLQVYGGRSRLHSARVLRLPEIPIVVRPELDVVGFAIESRIARGQLTSGGIAMALFKIHPELNNVGGRPAKKPAEVPQVSLKDAQDQSFAKLARQYGVDRDLFTILREARRTLSKAQWADLEHKVFELEIPLGRAYAGVRGGEGMKLSEKGRMETAYFEGWEDEKLWRKSLFASSATTLKNALARYSTEDRAVKMRIKQEAVSLWVSFPDDVRKACKEEA